MQRFIVAILIVFSLVSLSESIYAADQEINLNPIRSLLLGNRKFARSTVNDGVIVIGAEKIGDVIAATVDIDDNTLLQLSGELAIAVQVNSLLFITGGADSRFPFGLAGRAIDITPNGDDTTAKLEKVTYADIFKETVFDFSNIPLDASNFIGVIAPTAVQPSLDALSSLDRVSSGKYYSFRDGAIVVSQSLNNSTQEMLDGTFDVGSTVAFNIQINLADLEKEAGSLFPSFPSGGTGDFVITGSLGNMRITDNTKFTLIDGLETLYLRLNGDINYDVNFTGNVNVKFGDFTQAWKEVEAEKAQLLGQSVTLNGLNSDDKIGKFPLVGLAYSIPCPAQACPVTTSEGDIQQTKAFGVIVWLYLDLNGEYGVNGEISFARLSTARLSLGVRKSSGDDLEVIGTLDRKASSGRLLVAPEVDGSVGLDIQAGIKTDLDVFMGGLRVANTGIDLAANSQMSFTTISGPVNNGTDSLSSPWIILGDSTFTYTIGAGGIFDAAVAFGVAIGTSWDQLDADGSYEYGIQLPTVAEMLQPGWHDAWYKSSGDYPQCDIYHLHVCMTEGDCLAAGGYWWDNNTCNSSPPTVISGGGRIWMDRNLGASQVATAVNDAAAYGDLYQWGRDTDGHENRGSGTTTTLSSSDTPGHGNFILSNTGNPVYYDWRYPANGNLWQGVNGINNPCPSGFRIPTETEWENERISWSSNNAAGAFASPLKLVVAGYRYRAGNGELYGVGVNGHYWASSLYGHGSNVLDYNSSDAFVHGGARAYGFSVRCIKD